MERYNTFMDQNEYCYNVQSTHSTYKFNAINLQIQCNLYQNPNGIFHRNRKQSNHKICMEPPKILNSQNNLEQVQS